MRNVRKLLVGTAVAGALAAGIFAAPAASAATASAASTATAATTASTASQASSGWRYVNVGGRDGRIAYQWGRKGGRYWLDFQLWDRDRHDRGYTFFDVYYKRDGRWHHYKRYSTKSFYDKGNPIFFPSDVDDIRFRGGYGWNDHFGWSGYHNYR
ncbi:hypothetical protein [Nonomuraea jiangxiensis]|uniref:Uncharacterized protein n=1 Tax=Nonomuraea jiangxiensis TaxID=633440 RepID=A0A1G8TUL5_9ACTN|nr:hypothetical protein [Nonomuraea jiangxiensis]SDJ45084.1 hypothetical protein SAMN05421869_110288 [Nonomuraea jiangxiensis]